MTIKDNRDYIGVLLDPYYATITGKGILLKGTLKLSLEDQNSKKKSKDARVHRR